MNIEKFTINASKRIADGQSIANINRNPEINEFHILSAILSSNDSIINEILDNI